MNKGYSTDDISSDIHVMEGIEVKKCKPISPATFITTYERRVSQLTSSHTSATLGLASSSELSLASTPSDSTDHSSHERVSLSGADESDQGVAADREVGISAQFGSSMSSTELASISAAKNRGKMIDILNELVVVSEVQEGKVDELFAKHKSIVDKTDKIQHDFEGLQANYLKKVSECTGLETEEAKDAVVAELTSKLKQRDAKLLEAEEKIKELNKLVRELSISN